MIRSCGKNPEDTGDPFNFAANVCSRPHQTALTNLAPPRASKWHGPGKPPVAGEMRGSVNEIPSDACGVPFRRPHQKPCAAPAAAAAFHGDVGHYRGSLVLRNFPSGYSCLPSSQPSGQTSLPSPAIKRTRKLSYVNRRDARLGKVTSCSCASSTFSRFPVANDPHFFLSPTPAQCPTDAFP